MLTPPSRPLSGAIRGYDMKRKRKCVARSWGESAYCDGCTTNSTKCPYRFKYAELRNTKKGKAYDVLRTVTR